VALKPMTLFVKCMACSGTRKTNQTFNAGQRNELPKGSPRPLCEDGYCEFGATGGQFEKITTERDWAVVAADQFATAIENLVTMAAVFRKTLPAGTSKICAARHALGLDPFNAPMPGKPRE
jgi:hypothetical protein